MTTTQDLLQDLVLEKGIVNIIIEMKYKMEHKEKYDKVMKQLLKQNVCLGLNCEGGYSYKRIDRITIYHDYRNLIDHNDYIDNLTGIHYDFMNHYENGNTENTYNFENMDLKLLNHYLVFNEPDYEEYETDSETEMSY
jgi:hypothetical protein